MLRTLLVSAAAIVILICLGGVYAWSAYVPPLRTACGYSSAQTQLVFGTTIAVFTLMMTWAGRLLPRWGPRRNALLSALLFLAGYALAAWSRGSFLLLWFPNRKGLVTGCAAAGFGGGAVFTTWCINYLLSSRLSVAHVFEIIGAGSTLLMSACALVLQMPSRPANTPCPAAPPVSSLLSQRLFWTLATGMWCGTFAGLLVIGNLQSTAIEAGLSSAQASLAISLFALGNAAGRITWGRLCDRYAYCTIPLSLASLSASLVVLSLLHTPGFLFVLITFLIGFGFGACFVLYAAHVAARYGTAQFSAVYPLVFLAYGIAGITGPLVGGWLHDWLGNYWWAIIIAAVIVAAGAVVCHTEPRRSVFSP